jgi:predicted RNA binding protein YcfA (HicA-like mRNA interferase family)
VTWSSDDVARVLRRLGFERTRRGAHDVYVKPGHPRIVSVPRDRAVIPAGTVASIWRQAGITAVRARALR